MLGRPVGRGQACPTNEVSVYCVHRAWAAVSRNNGALTEAGAPDGASGCSPWPKGSGVRGWLGDTMACTVSSGTKLEL